MFLKLSAMTDEAHADHLRKFHHSQKFIQVNKRNIPVVKLPPQDFFAILKHFKIMIEGHEIMEITISLTSF
jgi:hypothetical protein